MRVYSGGGSGHSARYFWDSIASLTSQKTRFPLFPVKNIRIFVYGTHILPNKETNSHWFDQISNQLPFLFDPIFPIFFKYTSDSMLIFLVEGKGKWAGFPPRPQIFWRWANPPPSRQDHSRSPPPPFLRWLLINFFPGPRDLSNGGEGGSAQKEFGIISTSPENAMEFAFFFSLGTQRPMTPFFGKFATRRLSDLFWQYFLLSCK